MTSDRGWSFQFRKVAFTSPSSILASPSHGIESVDHLLIVVARGNDGKGDWRIDASIGVGPLTDLHLPPNEVTSSLLNGRHAKLIMSPSEAGLVAERLIRMAGSVAPLSREEPEP